MSKIQFLVSTMQGRFQPTAARLRAAACVVVNQDQREGRAPADYAAMLRTYGATVQTCAEKGLSKSRNRAMAAATADICVIADDDVEWVYGAEEVIKEIFSHHQNVDIITFMAKNLDGSDMSKYRRYEFLHNKFSISRVTSFEIAFRRDRVKEKGLVFDERFGLGSIFISGEENIFLYDSILSGLKILFVPETLVMHPGPTSGGRFEDQRLAESKGALIRRMYGNWSIILLFVFAIKKTFQARVSFAHLCKNMLRGWVEFGKM